MFAKLKRSILKKRFNRVLSKYIKNRTVSEKVIKSIGILTTNEIASKVNLQKEIEDILNIRNSKIYSYRPYDKQNKPSYKYFSENDINWKGKFVEPSIENFLEQNFDLLIGFYPKNNLYLEYATLASKATFKTGLADVNSSLYELEISDKTNQIKKFGGELKKYLQAMNKLKN